MDLVTCVHVLIGGNKKKQGNDDNALCEVSICIRFKIACHFYSWYYYISIIICTRLTMANSFVSKHFAAVVTGISYSYTMASSEPKRRQQKPCDMYCREQNFGTGNIAEFGECMAIHQNFPCCYFALYGECVTFSAAVANLLPVN